ncbi:MAG: hypothetical protein EOO45_17750 [Flavobacterium sp.]|nr:MAG: hypothetical protein EOO45_17750 [Flavobacterium sp.]
MKKNRSVLYVLVLLLVPLSVFSQRKFNPALSKTIDSLRAVDQAPSKLPKEQASKAWQEALRSNYPHLKAILHQYGFPGIREVGKESSHNYWLVIQHIDFDVEFQKEVLKEMKKQVDKKNASGEDYAFLIDRIEQNEKRPQIYGTQVNMGPAGTKLYATIDTINLDKRRRFVGLGPIAEYLKKCDEVYKALNNGTLDKIRTKDDSLKMKPKYN